LNQTPEQTAKKPSGLRVYRRLMAYVKPYWLIFLVSVVGYLIFAGTQPMFATLIEYVVDSIQEQNREGMYWVPGAFVGIIVLRGIGAFLGSYYLAKVSLSVVHTLRCKMFERYLQLPNVFFDNRNSGHLISRVTHDVQQVTTAATVAVKIVVREGLTVIALLGYLIYMNWKLSLIFIAIAPVIALLVNYASKRLRKISRKIQVSMGNITHVASEMINGFRVVRSFGGEEYERARFDDASRYNFRQSLNLVRTTAIHSPLLQLIVALALSALIYLALLLMTKASAGSFVAYITAAGLIPRSLRQLSGANTNIQRGIAAAESIFEILDEPGEVDEGRKEVEHVKGDLQFIDLTFSYEGTDNPVLRDISFTVPSGKRLALVGRSGSGKTTLASLIPRFYDYHRGRILLDGVEIKRYTRKNLRQQIALVTQHVTLFNDTVEKNIAYGSLAGAPREAVIEAATAANAMEFIEKLPAGLDTLVGENGVKLSGGQRQRLAIARALLKDAPVLILDEATSALDTESERKIQEALNRAMQGRTTIVIAHRLSTVENADAILVLDKGRIVERGNHKELLASDGYYAQLYRAQFKEQPEDLGAT